MDVFVIGLPLVVAAAAAFSAGGLGRSPGKGRRARLGAGSVVAPLADEHAHLGVPEVKEQRQEEGGGGVHQRYVSCHESQKAVRALFTAHYHQEKI